MVADALPLTGGLALLPAAPGRVFLLPGKRDVRACQQLGLRCRQLAQAVPQDSRVPGDVGMVWLQVEGQRLPLPEVAEPRGLALSEWLRSAEAGAPALVTLLGDLVVLVDRLAAAGFRPGLLELDGVWVEQGTLSWLPGALLWARTARVPSGANLQAASRTIAVFLHRLLQRAKDVPGIDVVWEELWAVCHDLLEHGMGCNGAPLVARLNQLARRTVGAVEGELTGADTWVLVDAASLHRHLRYQTLDLPGLLRQLAGRQTRLNGTMFGLKGLPPHFREQARLLGLTTEEGAPDPVAEADRIRESGAGAVWLLCGNGADAAATAAWLHPPKGMVIALLPLPAGPGAGWQSYASLPVLVPWLRLGWSRGDNVEVPADA